MTQTFIWSDLSTFDIESTKVFYKHCFSWNYHELDNSYIVCEVDNNPSSGIYTMPDKFQSIGMPSFWMSYIKVQDIQQTVNDAKEFGAIVEIQPQAAPGGGLIALIRDPAGAGFTCYEGEGLDDNRKSGSFGCTVWNELHVSDISKIESFYTHVFGWSIKPSSDIDRYLIYSSVNDTEAIAGIQVTSNSVKGDKEYWGVYFCVNSLATMSKNIKQNGGKIVAEQPLGNQPAVLAYDPQGAAFYITERKPNMDPNGGKLNPREIKWRAIIGLIIVALAVLSELNWIWGLLFLFWIVPDLMRGSTHFLEHVERRKNPIVYWLIISVWLALSLYLLFENVFDF